MAGRRGGGGLKVVDEIPPPRRPPAKTVKYQALMQRIREEVGPGKAVELGTFKSKAGASTTRRNLIKGLLPVDGDIADWDLQARRVHGNSDDGYRSVLYATLVKKGRVKK